LVLLEKGRAVKLIVFMVLVIIGCTADAAFTLGVMGAAMNLTEATPKPEASLYIMGDIIVIVGLLIAVPFRVRYLVRSATQRVGQQRMVSPLDIPPRSSRR